MIAIRSCLYCILISFVSLAAALGQETETTHQTDPAFLQKIGKVSSYTVAILPMENMTVDPEIAFHFRTRITERLTAKGYTVVNNEILNRKLYDLGVSHAGQLGLLAFEQLRRISSADGFLSGIVEQSAIQHAGVYNAYVYMCSVKLQDRQGNVVWSSLQNRVAKRRFALDPINALLDIALTEAGGDSREAVYALADQMLASLPDGPVQVITGDPLLDMAVEVEAKPNPEKNK